MSNKKNFFALLSILFFTAGIALFANMFITYACDGIHPSVTEVLFSFASGIWGYIFLKVAESYEE